MNRVKDICEELGIIYSSEFQEVADEIITRCISIAVDAGEIIYSNDRMVDPRSFTGTLIDEYFNE